MSQELSSSSLDQRARRIVAWVAALNLIGFFGEFIIASIIGSASLFADAADFLEDFSHQRAGSGSIALVGDGASQSKLRPSRVDSDSSIGVVWNGDLEDHQRRRS